MKDVNNTQTIMVDWQLLVVGLYTNEIETQKYEQEPLVPPFKFSYDAWWFIG